MGRAQRAAEEAEEKRSQQIAQARADLYQIFRGALEYLRSIVPAADLQEEGMTDSWHRTARLTLSAGGVRLQIELWPYQAMGSPVPGDTMVLPGCVMASNPAHPELRKAANVVYEQAGDRLVWQIYKFRLGSVPPDSRWGPPVGTVGLSQPEFFHERPYMLNPAHMHVWAMKTEPLTASTTLQLFQEAFEFRPDPPTGIYRR